MDEVRYMISEASKRVGVEDHVLRYWEKELELPIARNEMRNRYYRESDIELLQTIKNLKNQGFQLKAIKMLLPNINNLKSLDSQTILRLKDELNGRMIDVLKDEKTPETENEVELEADKETSLVSNEDIHEIEEKPNEKMEQFKAIMHQIILSALKENNAELKEEISTNVTDNISKEMKFLMRLQEEKEEERFRKLDSTIRDYQKSRMMAAATLDGKSKRKSKFFKKNNRVYI
ncbi:MAG: MerR family transcriptional regulator [Clostridiales bacterium]|nr:MerR family transcriptional regulator [Clostridiales bacterium]